MTATRCDGCLGSGSCWVCLGTGNLNTTWTRKLCERCKGTGICWLCRELPDVATIPQPSAHDHRRDDGASEPPQVADRHC